MALCQLCELCEAGGEARGLPGGSTQGGEFLSAAARKQVCLGPSGGVEYLNPGVTILRDFNGKNVDHPSGELVINSAPYHHINVFLDRELNISPSSLFPASTFPALFRKF